MSIETDLRRKRIRAKKREINEMLDKLPSNVKMRASGTILRMQKAMKESKGTIVTKDSIQFINQHTGKKVVVG